MESACFGINRIVQPGAVLVTMNSDGDAPSLRGHATPWSCVTPSIDVCVGRALRPTVLRITTRDNDPACPTCWLGCSRCRALQRRLGHRGPCSPRGMRPAGDRGVKWGQTERVSFQMSCRPVPHLNASDQSSVGGGWRPAL